MSEITAIKKSAPDQTALKLHEKGEEKKATPSSPMGIFDSGVGGLTVLKELLRQLPGEDVIYLADTARLPYGNRPPEEIIKFNLEIIPFIIEQGAKLIVMACGTSSAIAYPVVKDKFKVQIIGLIEPGAKAAAAATKNGRLGLIATAGTVASQAYQKALLSLDKNLAVFAQACPLFVPLIENGHLESEETKKIAREYLAPLLKEGIDTLILGCTHYPHLRKILQEITGPKVVLIDPAEEAVAETAMLLKKMGTLKPKGSLARFDYLVTGPIVPFQNLGSRLLGKPLTGVRQAILPKG